MKYPYRVKHNGIWYDANTEIPDGKKEKVEEVKEEPKAEDPIVEEEPKTEDVAVEIALSADEIEAMSRPDLLNMAKEQGIKKYTTMKTEDLKKELIAKLGL